LHHAVESIRCGQIQVAREIDSHVLGFDHSRKISDAASTILANHGFRTIATARYSAIR
jgi:hypothetical protein